MTPPNDAVACQPGQAPTQTTKQTHEAPPAVRHGRRWRYVLLGVVVLGIGSVVFHAPILCGLASWLNVGEPFVPTEYMVLLRDDLPLEEVVRFCREAPAARVVLLGQPPRRLQRMGILPATTDVLRRELLSQGIAAERVTVLEFSTTSGWDDLRTLGAWLAERPDGEVTALAPQLESRTYRHRLRATLPENVRRRLRVCAIPHPWFDATNWWKRKEGAVGVFNAYLRFGYDVCHGEDGEPWREWSVESYQKSLRQQTWLP